MIPEIKEQWLIALRSGEYKQGEGRLKRIIENSDGEAEARYCCLGVLCDIAIQSGIEIDVTETEPWPRLNGAMARGVSFNKQVSALPEAVQEWSGVGTYGEIETPVQIEGRNHYYSDLAELNDSGHNFDEIADVIERKL